MNTRAVGWGSPLALGALIVAGNIWMAVAYAQWLTARPGLAGAFVPGNGLEVGLPGFWAVFFGLLGLNNGLVLAVFARWVAAVRREQVAQAEILAAMRWSAVITAPRRDLWLDTPLAVASRPRRSWAWHLPYVAGLLAALALPAALLDLIVL
jgi:hypothetical protein